MRNLRAGELSAAAGRREREKRESHALWVKPVEVSSVVGKQPFGRGLQRTSKAYGDFDEKRTPIR